jgi:acid phosphatase family membrane protein YuiD
LTVSAGTAYVDVAPRLVRDFSRQVVKDMQAQGLTREVERSGQESGRRFGRRFSGGLRTGIGPVRGILRGFGPQLAVAFGGAALVAGIKSVTDEAREAAVVGKITEARLKSTGGVANITARQIEGLATALSNKVGVDDEAIQSGMNLMLTFKGVRNEAGRGNDIFNQATKTAVDLAAGMNNGKVSIEGLGGFLHRPAARADQDAGRVRRRARGAEDHPQGRQRPVRRHRRRLSRRR